MKNNCKKCYEENKTPNIEDCNCCKMPKKYVIKNCPALRFKLIPLKENPICSKMPFEECCKDITDCVMKRIVERCSLYEFNYPVNQAIIMLTQNIKNMLEIEECE